MQKLLWNDLYLEPCRITCFTDTYGVDANNGVGRFLSDLHWLTQQVSLPWNIIAPGKREEEPGVHYVRAPAFTIPGYNDAPISMPLEHHRRTISHKLKDWDPEVIHVSTPGPFGLFGISLASKLNLPLVGIYHTDFPAYVREMVRSRVEQMNSDPSQLMEHVSSLPLERAGDMLLTMMQEMKSYNQDFDQDLSTVIEIVQKNWSLVSGKTDWIELTSQMAYLATLKLMKQFYSRFNLVVARSVSQENELRYNLGIDPAKIRTLIPGTNPELFHPRYADRNLWKAQGLPEDAFVVLYVGRINSEKNFDFLLEVWKAAKQKHQKNDRPLHLIVVGNGEESLLEKARQQEDVHLLGPQKGEDLSKIYASADLLLFPSNTETLGQVGLEAGAAGTPVIVSNQGGPGMYVQQDKTGFVMSTIDPASWADRVLELSRDKEKCRWLSENARNHIASHHTLKASLDSYWQIHEEAITLANKQRLEKIRIQQIKHNMQPNRQHRDGTGVMVISDYHAGKGFSSQKLKLQKEAAIEKMLERAIDLNLKIVYGGDFGDHGARPARLEEDFTMLRRVHQRVGLHEMPLFLRGNHDYGFTDKQLSELLGGCPIHNSLVYFEPHSKVTITHGHILGLHKIIDVIKATSSRQEIEDALTEENLDEELKPSVIAYDLANLTESYSQQMGLMGLGRFWEGLFKTRSAFAEAILYWGKFGDIKDRKTWKMIASLVGSQNDMEVAALLGTACGSWATVYGHTHEPVAERLQVQRDQLGKPESAEVVAFDTKRKSAKHESQSNQAYHLVGNSGNMNRKRPSCLIARFPEIRVYRYHSDNDKLKISHRAWLHDQDIQQYRETLNSQVLPIVPALKNTTDYSHI